MPSIWPQVLSESGRRVVMGQRRVLRTSGVKEVTMRRLCGVK